ncbi:MAG: CU044_2847 family protein [Rhizonema sp. PD37]|nr:CU044_2847 family protein [Rhizonema sp. PD37]
MELQTKIVTVELTDGTLIRVEATLIGERKISFQTRPFEEVSTAIESLTKEIAETVHRVKPDKASVKFGIDIGIESGKLTAVLAKSSSTANLEITLEWCDR